MQGYPLDAKTRQALDEISKKLHVDEQRKKIWAQEAQTKVGKPVKLNLEARKSGNETMFRCTIGGFTYAIDSFHSSYAQPGICFAVVEKFEKDILWCKPLQPMAMHEIEDVYKHLKESVDKTDATRLPRVQENLNETVETLQYYERWNEIFDKEYAEKIPKYITQMKELGTVIDGKLARSHKFDKPASLAFKHSGKGYTVRCENEIVAELDIRFNDNKPVVMKVTVAAGYNSRMLLEQLFGQLGGYVKQTFSNISEVYVVAETELQSRVLEHAGYLQFKKLGSRFGNDKIFYKPL